MREERSSSFTFLKTTVNNMAGKMNTARKNLHLRLGHTPKPLRFRIVVMGAEEVGKTAYYVAPAFRDSSLKK
ncbi:hypothetical protein JTE90_021833 [Oedothorax gibbosus]|uniref:Uncharacterized protein n=1 Tax=Oedothorax gibbosus TaxID=931172 RepID=A0AAV6UY26_9ARAC|nr:hypothetical protein JTE90_021833 [Oedothorax gibbosus]